LDNHCGKWFRESVNVPNLIIDNYYDGLEQNNEGGFSILKYLFRIVLVLMLVASMILPTKFNHTVEASTTDYYNLLMQEVRSIGIMNQEDFDSYGVVYAKVADFDQNGPNELYIVTRPTPDGDYEERLYEGDELVYESGIPRINHRSGVSLSIGEGKQAIYLSYPGDGGAGGSGVGKMSEYYNTDRYYVLENSQVKKVLDMTIWEFDYDMEILSEYIEEVGEDSSMITEEEYRVYQEWDGDLSSGGTGITYLMDDNEVSKETYEKKLKPYDNVKWESIINGGSFNESTPAVDSEAIVNQLLNQLEKVEKPKNLGEDLYDSWDEEQKVSLVDWLMYSQWFGHEYKMGTKLNDQELFGFLFEPNGGSGAIKDEIDTVDRSTFPENTDTRMNGQEVDQFLSMYLGQTFTEKDFVLGDVDFPFVKKEGYYYFPDFAMGWNSYVVPYIRGVYEISQDVYYIDFTEYQLIQEEFASLTEDEVWTTPATQLYDLITEDERKKLHIENRGYAVMKKTLIDGEYKWTLIERNMTEEALDETKITQYEKQKQAPAQIKLELKEADTYSTVEDYVGAIQKEITSKELNEQDRLLLTQYITVALQKLTMQSLEASRNTLILTKEQLEASMSELRSSEQQLVEALELEKLSLPKPIERIHRMNATKTDVTKPVRVQLNKDLLEKIDVERKADDSLYISFDGRSMGVAMKYGQLESILQEHGQVTLIFTYSANQVEVAFENKDGTIKKLNSAIQISMPAETETSMVYENEELWGGQSSKETNNVVFETKHAGTFTVKNNEVALTDIAKLTDEQQQAITYLVTRGFFEVEDDKFEASKTISRNEYAKTLVRLFYSLDKDAKTTFTDVKEDSPYYQFIASGEQNEIINGYEDKSFRGDNLISISDILSLSGRTLANKKGYDFPTNAEDYLDFFDADSINEEARDEIALAVREGLIEQGGLLEPNRQITRLEAVEIMYKLYMLLYEQPFYGVEAELEKAVPFYTEYKWPLLGGGAGVVASLATVIFLRRRKLKLESAR